MGVLDSHNRTSGATSTLEVFPTVNKNKAPPNKPVKTVVDGPHVHHTVICAFTPWKKVNAKPCDTNMYETCECVIDLVHKSCIRLLPVRCSRQHSPSLGAFPSLNDILHSLKNPHMVVPMKTPCKGTSRGKPSVFQGFGALVKALGKLAEFGDEWNVHTTLPPIQLIDGRFYSYIAWDTNITKLVPHSRYAPRSPKCHGDFAT